MSMWANMAIEGYTESLLKFIEDQYDALDGEVDIEFKILKALVSKLKEDRDAAKSGWL